MFRRFRQAASGRTAPGHDPRQGQPASLRRRLASMLYEILLLLGVLSLTFIVPYLIIGVLWKFMPPGPVLWSHLFLVLGCYFVWYWRKHGQTLSMQTWRIRLVSVVDLRNPSLKQCLVRYVLAWPSVLFFGAGLVWALFDRDGQFLHDRFSGTRLVYFDPLVKD